MKLKMFSYLLIGLLLFLASNAASIVAALYFMQTSNTGHELRVVQQQYRLLQQQDRQEIERYQQLIYNTYLPLLSCNLYHTNRHLIGRYFVTDHLKAEMQQGFSTLGVTEPTDFCHQHL